MPPWLIDLYPLLTVLALLLWYLLAQGHRGISALYVMVLLTVLLLGLFVYGCEVKGG